VEHRKRNRLPQFDYSRSGVYFVTLCTEDKRQILSRVVGDGVLDVPRLALTDVGTIVQNRLIEMDRIYEDVALDNYVIMPNHVHLLLTIHQDDAETGTSRTSSPTNARLPQFVSTLKRFTNRESGIAIWQRSYHDHVIRNEEDYLHHWQYIDENPIRWADDEYYCAVRS